MQALGPTRSFIRLSSSADLLVFPASSSFHAWEYENWQPVTVSPIPFKPERCAPCLYKLQRSLRCCCGHFSDCKSLMCLVHLASKTSATTHLSWSKDVQQHTRNLRCSVSLRQVVLLHQPAWMASSCINPVNAEIRLSCLRVKCQGTGKLMTSTTWEVLHWECSCGWYCDSNADQETALLCFGVPAAQFAKLPWNLPVQCAACLPQQEACGPITEHAKFLINGAQTLLCCVSFLVLSLSFFLFSSLSLYICVFLDLFYVSVCL